jgi:hypothetical protein
MFPLLFLLPTFSLGVSFNESSCTFLPAVEGFASSFPEVLVCPNATGVVNVGGTETLDAGDGEGDMFTSYFDVWLNSTDMNAAYGWLPTLSAGLVSDYWLTLTLLGTCDPHPQVSARIIPIPLDCSVSETTSPVLAPDGIPGALPLFGFSPLALSWMAPPTVVVSETIDSATNVTVGSPSLLVAVPSFSNGTQLPARFSHFGGGPYGVDAQGGGRTYVCGEEAAAVSHRRARGFWLRLKRLSGSFGSADGPQCGMRLTLVERDVSAAFPGLELPATPAPPTPPGDIEFVTSLPDSLDSPAAYAAARGCDPDAPVLATTNWSTSSTTCQRGCWVASLGPEGDCRNDDPSDTWVGDPSTPFASGEDKRDDEKQRLRDEGIIDPVCNMAGYCIGFTCRCYGSLGAFDCSEADDSDLRTTEVVNSLVSEAMIHGLGQARFAAVTSATNSHVDLTIRLNLADTLRTGVKISSVVTAVRVVPGLGEPTDIDISGFNDLVQTSDSAVHWRAECNHTGDLGTVWQNTLLSDATFGVPTYADDTHSPVVLRVIVGDEATLADDVAAACNESLSDEPTDDRLAVFRLSDSCPGVVALTRQALDEAGTGATIVISALAEVDAASGNYFTDLLGSQEDEVVLRYEATMALEDSSATALSVIGALLSATMLLYVLWRCFVLTRCNPITADDTLHNRFGPNSSTVSQTKHAAAAASTDNDVGAGDVVEKVEGDADAAETGEAGAGDGEAKAAALSVASSAGSSAAKEASGALFAAIALFELFAAELKVILNIVLMYRVLLQVYVPIPPVELFDAFGALRALAEALDNIAALVDVVSLDTFNCGGSVAVFAPFIFVLGVLLLVAIMQRGLLARVRSALHGPGSPSPVRRAFAKAGVTVALYFTQLLIAAMSVSALNLASETRTCSPSDRELLDLAQTVAPVLLAFLYVALVIVFGGYGDETYSVTGLFRLVLGPLQGAGRLVLLTGGIWVQTMTDGVVRVAAALGGDAGSSKTDAKEILAMQGASRGLFWILLPGGLVGAKLAEAANKRPVIVLSNHIGSALPDRTLFDRFSYAFNVASFCFSFGAVFGSASTMVALAMGTAAGSWVVGVIDAMKG